MCILNIPLITVFSNHSEIVAFLYVTLWVQFPHRGANKGFSHLISSHREVAIRCINVYYWVLHVIFTASDEGKKFCRKKQKMTVKYDTIQTSLPSFIVTLPYSKTAFCHLDLDRKIPLFTWPQNIFAVAM